MRRISDPLNNWGAKISLREDKYPPIEIAESKLLSNFVYELEIPSAQIKSCLLLAALSSKTKIEIIENIPSRDHTERLLQECDAEIFREGNKIIFDGTREITKKFIDVPKDFSSAAYLIAANILTNKDIPLKGIGVNKTRTAFLNVLEEMGAKIELHNACIISNEPRADITARFDTNLKGVSISGKSIPNLIDEIPLIAILAMFAEGKTTIRDAKELRYKESDRISLLLDNMKKFNPNIGLTEFEDGFEIIPSKNHDNDSVDLETGGDHRIIMSFVIAALVTGKKINFDETESVETSFPGFFEVIKSMVPIVTIDGPSGSGKGTISKALAIDLNWNYLDSGLIYRCYAFLHSIGVSDITQEMNYIDHEYDLEHETISYRNKNITDDIRGPAITKLSSELSQLSGVRDKLTMIQKTYRKEPGLVAEGRDMSSKLFPDSLVKIFLTANLEERVMRRANQLRNAGQKVNISELKNEIVLRDDRDTKRTQSPLKQTEDSIFIDSSEKTVGEITNLIKKLINEKY